jgi:hypothetical protein
VSRAVRHFWETRLRQAERQGSSSGQKDQGARSAVTGGAQLDGFIRLMSELLVESGLPQHRVFTHDTKTVLPGWFRPTKEWDLIAIVDGTVIATVEFKSQVGSFGNNYNNRTEEALGNATDILTAYREGAFKGSPRPWLGYFMLLQDAPGSTRPVKVDEPHFKVFAEFQGASYAKRYTVLCQKLVRERLYDSACLLLSDEKGGLEGKYREPLDEIGFRNFATSLMGHAIAFAKIRGK